jgi:hypothetical protein
MASMVQFAVLAAATAMAVVAAFGLNWIFLRAAFLLMQPATARPSATSQARMSSSIRSALVQGTRASARQLALRRQRF